jgi:nucleotide-binding universal stress UspA family protein
VFRDGPLLVGVGRLRVTSSVVLGRYLTDRLGLTPIFVHVARPKLPPIRPAWSLGAGLDGLKKELRTLDDHVLSGVRHKLLLAGIAPCETQVRLGDPLTDLRHVVDDVCPSLVVLGASRRTLLGGEVTRRMLALARCPVLVVPTVHSGCVEGPVLVEDRGDVTHVAVSIARDLALACGVPLWRLVSGDPRTGRAAPSTGILASAADARDIPTLTWPGRNARTLHALCMRREASALVVTHRQPTALRPMRLDATSRLVSSPRVPTVVVPARTPPP